jgi:hypothetical protein
MGALALSPIRYRSAPRGRYQQQDTTQTLAEALDEYYSLNAGVVVRPVDLSPESAELFRSHDLCHVIFGLDTTFEDEAMADVRTMLSCDVGVRHYATYLASDAQAKKILKEVGLSAFLWGTVIAIPRLLKAVRASWQMPKRWPWRPPDSYQQRSLGDLRREYGVRVI